MKKRKILSSMMSYAKWTTCGLCFLLSLGVAHGQEGEGKSTRDTIILPLRLPLSMPEIQYSPVFQIKERPNISFLVWKSFHEPPVLSEPISHDVFLQSIWRNEVARQDEYKALKTVLTSVQAGAVATLAYLHFKKYGF